ncbi:hypothetical protein [Noviherbaspirillum pedocola]|uniref:Uncharacterized protein n=1 Tax=Noviherbaspirillum pedocola TaxID=2801341 RepID=A0A934SRX4_9BURK|nr:hypothetical protein [Noviherbaspirillum pedocola]MBK4734389.1 hypothetical protein [Noviherbaspirillum pedocola]
MQTARSPQMKSGREETEESARDQPPAKRPRLDEAPAFTTGQSQAGAPMPTSQEVDHGEATNRDTDEPSSDMDTSDAEPLPPDCVVESYVVETVDLTQREFLACMQAASWGDAQAQCRLARMYYEGEVCRKTHVKRWTGTGRPQTRATSRRNRRWAA